ncbi:uncharacterized protein LOC124358783 [Homalodisca vitripennis]|uniref:uncharacterized protein LOC124358783 n=1 Tax=Homalodisca vitripennis TaxID=197043 RepID=UPI001EEBEFBA|nr:uncharacterized protein LOC124358783 [Homalodisca vitripennis]
MCYCMPLTAAAMVSGATAAGVLCCVLHIVAARLRTPPALAAYYVFWDGGIKDCDGFKNEAFDLSALRVEKKSKTDLALVGDVNFKINTSKPLGFKCIVSKKVNDNFEFFMKFEKKNLCRHVGEKGKPWSPFFQEMNVSNCPIPKKIYNFKDSHFDTASVPLTIANKGSYRGRLEFYEEGTMVACFLAEATVQAE